MGMFISGSVFIYDADNNGWVGLTVYDGVQVPDQGITQGDLGRQSSRLSNHVHAPRCH